MPWLLVLFTSGLIVTVTVSTSYRVEDRAHMACTLATPEIEFGESSNKVKLYDGILDRGRRARVGYVLDFVELQYIGCIHRSTIDNFQHIRVSTSRDVGQCYSACSDNYTVIGLTSRGGSSACLCFGDDMKSRIDKLDGCKTECGVFVCGSKRYVSLYEKVKVENAAGQDNGRSESCLTVSMDGYNWRKCDDGPCDVACFTDIDDAISLSFQYFCFGPWSGTWFKGVLKCSTGANYPMKYRRSLSVDWDKQRWTGVIQTIAIRKRRVEDSQPGKAFGYVEKSDEGYILNFDESLDSIDQSICVDETVSPSTDKTGTSQTPESSSTSPASPIDVDPTSPFRSTQTPKSTTIPPENTSIAETSATNHNTTTTSNENQHMSDSMESPKEGKGEEESNVGLYIGLPMAVLVLVGMGVVVLVLWKRRRKPLKEKETPSTLQNNVTYQNNNAMIAQTNMAYEEVDKPSDVPSDQANVYDLCKDDDKDSQHVYGNSYFVLEKAKDGAEYSEVSKAREKKTESTDNAYFVLEKEKRHPDPDDTDYGSSYSGPLRSEAARDVPEGHVYNTAGSVKLSDDTTDEYDHIGRTSGCTLTESNHYDTTFAHKPIDDTYDSTLLNTSANRNKTDEIYDKANNAANNVYANVNDD